MTPERAYKIRPRMFQIIPYSHTVTLPPPLAEPGNLIRCGLCYYQCREADWQQTPWEVRDVAGLAEACRQHEITAHSTTVDFAQFYAGYNVCPTPSLREQMQASDATALLFRREHRVFEWLDDDGQAPPAMVTVRDPQQIGQWDAFYAPRAAQEVPAGAPAAQP